jgi:protein disulfide-isomerase A6
MTSNLFAVVLLLTVAVLANVRAFYSSNDDVIQLDPSNFDRLVVQSSDIWFVEFYATWCGRK